MPDYDGRYPAISDLARRAERRLPKFAFEYLAGGIGDECGLQHNRRALDAVQLIPRYFRDVSDCEVTAELFGERYAMPIGIAPVGLAGMVWPNAETILAAAAARANIPFTMSTVGTTSLESIAEIGEGKAWYQLYPTADFAIAEDLLARAAAAGYKVLVVTVDIPVGPKRERDLRNGLTLPLRLTPAMLYRTGVCPRWLLGTLRHGLPRFVNLVPYAAPELQKPGGLATFAAEILVRGVTTEYLKKLRDRWNGILVVKGVLSPEDADTACALGADGVIVSNHGGRQLDAAPAAIDALAAIVQAIGDRCVVLMDSGIRSGMDVLRALALGAKFTFSGRSFYYGVGALGAPGGMQAVEIFRDEISRGLAQLGCRRITELDQRWVAQRR